MKTFRIYQAQLTDGQRMRLNGPNGGWDCEPELSAYSDLGFGTRGIDSYNADSLVEEVAAHGMFRHTANITCEDLHEVFQIGNIGPESAIWRFQGEDMFSVSIGNVVVDLSTGKAWMVDNFGFVELHASTLAMIERKTTTHIQSYARVNAA